MCFVGKTYSMFGSQQDPGLVSNILNKLFLKISVKKNIKFYVAMNLIEIRDEVYYDMFQKNDTPILVKYCSSFGLRLPDIAKYAVKDYETSIKLISEALGDCSMNTKSDVILNIFIIQKSYDSFEENLFSNILLVDIGNEASLSSLKKVIHNCHLMNQKPDPPETKLTFLLNDCFEGNYKTFMIGTVSPSQNNVEATIETIHTLSIASKI